MHSASPSRSITCGKNWLLLVAATLGVAGCGGEKKTDTAMSVPALAPAPSPAAGTGVVSSSHTTSDAGTPGDTRALTGKASQERDGPLPAGTLHKPIESYVDDPAAFWVLVKGKGWKGWERQRKCTGDPACAGGAPRAKMHVQAIRDAQTVKIKSLPANGVIIGRMINVGEYTDSATEVVGGQAVPDHRYFIIQRLTDQLAAMKVVVLKFQQTKGKLTPVELELLPGDREYFPCGVGPIRGEAEGDFKNCVGYAGGQTSVSRAQLEKATTLDAFAWFSCGEGCCNAQYPPLIGPKALVDSARKTGKE